ncbi:MAG TPA: acyl carrier protein [Candidatus Ozemobacteraceae bacterium]|nr:acyl carrier protein [Candidatus Ozemobacteraceae bacterium]
MQDRVLTFLRKQLEKKAPLPPESTLPAYRYLDRGHVDSLGLIKFIFEIEEEFQIQLTPEDTQSDEFRTIGGLAAMIRGKLPK